VFLLVAFWILCFFSTLFAFFPTDAWDYFIRVSKIFLMTFLTMFLIQDAKRIRALIWVIALSIGFYGVKGGIWGLLTGGATGMVVGPPGSFITGNTEIGMALNMVLPMFLFLRREEKRVWLRHALLGMFGLSFIAILMTYSRGAFLGLVVVLSMLFLKSRVKLIGLLLILITLPIVMVNLPERWHTRMDTIQNYEEDPSAMGRINAWKLAYALALERPFLGAGFRPFAPEIYQEYINMRLTSDAHSIFFQVLAEHGFTGLILYGGLVFSTWLTLRGNMRRSRGDPALQWAYNYSQMLEAALVAYIICGLFLGMAYFDLFYHFVAIAVVIKKIVVTQKPVLVSQTVRTGPLVAAPGMIHNTSRNLMR
jgi:probable O-glycosylation ligase (exosortase A-associated)